MKSGGSATAKNSSSSADVACDLFCAGWNLPLCFAIDMAVADHFSSICSENRV